MAVSHPSALLAALAALAGAGLVAVTGAAGASRGDDDPVFTGTKAVVDATWKEGWLVRGSAVHLTGKIDRPATVKIVLRSLTRENAVIVNRPFTFARAGKFDLTLPLGARPLPGRYGLRIRNDIDTREITRLTTSIPYPLEGVVDRAEVGTSLNGPWRVYDIDHHTSPVLRGKYKTLYTRFRFLAPPRGGRIQVVWSARWGQQVLGKKYKTYQDTIYTFAKSAQPLPPGTWLVTLVVNGRVAKRGSVRIVS